MNIFDRLRTNKQEKIAAVQRKIIAVRAAEDLDRRTNAKRSKLTLTTFLGPIFNYPPFDHSYLYFDSFARS